jgi:hypothetical protein
MTPHYEFKLCRRATMQKAVAVQFGRRVDAGLDGGVPVCLGEDVV